VIACALTVSNMLKRKSGQSTTNPPMAKRKITDFFRQNTAETNHDGVVERVSRVDPGNDELELGEFPSDAGSDVELQDRELSPACDECSDVQPAVTRVTSPTRSDVVSQASPSSSASGAISDVGDLLKTAATSKELELLVDALTDEEKHQILTGHFRPSKGYKFPSNYMNGCNRSFQETWLSKYPWLVYSPKLDGGFCLPCFLFARNRSGKGTLVNSPFKHWTKVSVTLGKHATLEYHLDCLTKAESFRCAYEQPSHSIATMGQDRLTSLALLHIHYDSDINVTKVVDRFAEVHPRRLEMTSIIYS